MEISKRLKTVANSVTKGNRVADIGTDHGYVPIFLVKQGHCSKALAMDINEGPLERAVDHIKEEGLSNVIETRLSDGMMELGVDEADTVVIAGMGGDLTCRILKAREDILKKGIEFVLQPQSEWFKVRHALHDHGYQIENEWFLKEDGKYYVVMKACPGKQSFSFDYEYEYGAFLEEECWPVLEEYLKKGIAKRESIAAGIRSHMDPIPKTDSEEFDEETMDKAEKRSKKNLSARMQRVEEIENEIRMLKERLRAGR